MIKLKLIRQNPTIFEQKYIHGELFIWSDPLKKWLDFCYTLEDTVRDDNKSGSFDKGEKKIYGKTAIPFGDFDGVVNYSPAFKREMPLLLNVPHFKGIRMHGGNTVEDSSGCILVGFKTNWKGKLWNTAEYDLTNILKQNGSKFKIEIT